MGYELVRILRTIELFNFPLMSFQQDLFYHYYLKKG